MTRVHSWEKSGLHRLYVNTDDGERLGWGNAMTGEIHIEADVDPNVVWKALCGHGEWPADALRPPQSGIRYVKDEPAAQQTQRTQVPNRDLAENKPGQAARERAELELAELAKLHPDLLKSADLSSRAEAPKSGWSKGANAEIEMAEHIDGLTQNGWFVLHSIPMGDDVIDHLAIGPGGVYAISTRMHLGFNMKVSGDSIEVEGRERAYIPEARERAKLATQVLSEVAGFEVPVYPILILLNGNKQSPRSVYIDSAPKDVAVRKYGDVGSELRSLPQKLDLIRAGLIYELARRSSTWT